MFCTRRDHRLTTIYIGNTCGYQDTQQAKSLTLGKSLTTCFSCRSEAMDTMTVPMAVLLALLLVVPSTAHDGHHHHPTSPDYHHNADATSPHHYQHNRHHHHHHTQMPMPVHSELLTHAPGPHHHGSVTPQ
jgi:hypothetical protein